MSLNVQIPKSPVDIPNFCGGEFVAGSGANFEVHSPYTNSLIGLSKSSTKADLDKIIAAARAAQVDWADRPMKERAQVLFALRNELLNNKEEMAHTISAECGKTHGESVAGLMKGIEVIEFATSLQNLDDGGRMEVSRGVFCEYRREALGVVAGVTPFNFPAMVPLWMMPIAVGLGNAFLWKPSDKTPLTSLLIAKAWQKAGLPKGILSLAQGGRQTVEAILDHPDVKAVGFVGSTAVAEQVYKRGTQNLKRVLALGGAKNHILLMPDADAELTGKGIADSFTGCAGQRCMAASVLCTIAPDKESEVKIDQLVQSIQTAASEIKAGENMGAIISKESFKSLNDAIAQAESDGAQVILDGRQTKTSEAYAEGNWLSPSIIDHVKPNTEAATKELFGPVLSIIRCKSLNEALKIATESPYGNAISIFTEHGPTAEHVAKNSKVGMVGINIGVPVPREPFSFGGVKTSKFGQGDITGASSLDFWSDLKKVTTKWASQKDHNWMS